MISLVSSGGLILTDAKNEVFRYFYPENDHFKLLWATISSPPISGPSRRLTQMGY